jgi:hypothetical protein
VWGGAALLGWIAAELIIGEQLLRPFLTDVALGLGTSVHSLEYVGGAAGALLVVGVGAFVMRARGDLGGHSG